MGNYCPPPWFYRRSSPVNPKNVTLLLVGLDNAGKTTIAKRLSEEPLDGVLPTVGFSKVSLEEKGCCITVYDLGGGPQIRDIWPRYYADVHGVIFVVDASDTARLDECRKALEGLLLDSYICGKPVLLLANKQDVEGALDEIDIVDRLNVERLVNQQKCPTLVELCSARHFSRKMDVGIDNGYRWLLRCISKDYPALNNRVLKDLATQEELERIKRAQREERIRRVREEREQEEKRMGLTKVESLHPSGDKPQQNGVIQMVDVAGIPGQIEDEDVSTGPVRKAMGSSGYGSADRPPFSVSYSCEFFKYEKDDSDMILLRSMDEGRGQRNFLVRPKSSGARLNATRAETVKRKALRKKSYQRNNKTAPSPMVEVTLEPIGSLPSVFDLSHRPNTRTVAVGGREGANGEGSGKTVVETVAQVEGARALSAREASTERRTQPTSKSVPHSREGSGDGAAKRRSISNDHVCGRLPPVGKLPPLRIGGRSPGRELILDVSKLGA